MISDLSTLRASFNLATGYFYYPVSAFLLAMKTQFYLLHVMKVGIWRITPNFENCLKNRLFNRLCLFLAIV